MSLQHQSYKFNRNTQSGSKPQSITTPEQSYTLQHLAPSQMGNLNFQKSVTSDFQTPVKNNTSSNAGFFTGQTSRQNLSISPDKEAKFEQKRTNPHVFHSDSKPQYAFAQGKSKPLQLQLSNPYIRRGSQMTQFKQNQMNGQPSGQQIAQQMGTSTNYFIHKLPLNPKQNGYLTAVETSKISIHTQPQTVQSHAAGGFQIQFKENTAVHQSQSNVKKHRVLVTHKM